MKTIEIIGENYFGKYDKVRVACRGIIINDGMILLSCDTLHNVYMLPGGGLEENETDDECVVREVKEETGNIIKAKRCGFEICEYYEDYKYITKYFYGEILGKTTPKLTMAEKELGMEARWVKLDSAINEFKGYRKYIGVDEVARGIYLREYRALCMVLENMGDKNAS